MIKNVLTKFTLNQNRTLQIKYNFTRLLFNQKKNFSNQDTSDKYQNLMKELNYETDEDKDLRYEDQSFFLDREMKNLLRDKKKYGQDYGTSDFPEYQQRELNCLVEIVNNFDFVEKNYFFYKLRENLKNNTDNRLHKQNSILLENNVEFDYDLSTLNPNNKKLDEILTPLIPYLTSEFFVGSGGGSSGASEAKEAEAGKGDEKKEEKKEVN